MLKTFSIRNGHRDTTDIRIRGHRIHERLDRALECINGVLNHIDDSRASPAQKVHWTSVRFEHPRLPLLIRRRRTYRLAGVWIKVHLRWSRYRIPVLVKILWHY
jgi:hypothetical protein